MRLSTDMAARIHPRACHVPGCAAPALADGTACCLVHFLSVPPRAGRRMRDLAAGGALLTPERLEELVRAVRRDIEAFDAGHADN